MVDAWKIYQSDIGLTYPLLAVNIVNLGEIETELDLYSLFDSTIQNQRVTANSTCVVPGLTLRIIKLYLADDSQYQINYPVVFSQQLFNSLSASLSIRAFEFIGEKIKYSRLRQMLNRGS